MIKIFETGDIHIGRTFVRYEKEEIKEKLCESRFVCLNNMVKEAEKEGCTLFVITGDIFDRVTRIKSEYVKRTVEILASFEGTVLVLPGNHDFYTEEAKVWKDFVSAMDKVEHNIILLNQYEKVSIDDGQINIYPAYCDSKHSEENRLAWIKDSSIDTAMYNIGIAHGAIQGVTPDMNGEYYQMSEAELLDIPMDVWLIGHTHIPYPKMELGKEYRGYKVYNAGTPEQQHFNNDTLGYGFIITVEKCSSGHTEITAKACRTGKITYHEKYISIDPAENLAEHVLEDAMEKKITGLGAYDIVKLIINGSVGQEEYKNRFKIYEKLLSKVMYYEVNDSELSERITRDKIYEEFPGIGLAAQVLEKLLAHPVEVQMAYDLLKECRE